MPVLSDILKILDVFILKDVEFDLSLEEQFFTINESVEVSKACKGFLLELDGSSGHILEIHPVGAGDAEHDGTQDGDADLVGHGLLFHVLHEVSGLHFDAGFLHCD